MLVRVFPSLVKSWLDNFLLCALSVAHNHGLYLEKNWDTRDTRVLGRKAESCDSKNE